MGAPSLVSTAQRLAARHVDAIQSFADTPVHLVRPILQKVSSPDQLRMLEEESPQIIGPDTVALWKSLIRRDIPNGDKNQLEPSNPASWGKVYRKLKREDEARRKAAEEQLRQSLGQQAAARQNNQATILHTVLPGRLEKGARKEPGSSRTFGQNALSALRKQSARSATPRSLHRPRYPNEQTGPSVPVARGKVAQAPISMINQYTRAQGGVALPAAALARPSPVPAAIPRPPGMRNPFRSTGATVPRVQQQALSLAMRVEANTQRAKQVESKQKAAAIRAQRSSPPVPARSTAVPAAEAGPSSSPARPTPPAPATKQQPASQAVKRKAAPNIFAPKRVRR